MNNEQKLSKLEFATLITFPLLTTYNFISFNTTIETSKINSYISVLYSSFIGLILLYIFIYISNYKPELTLTEKNITLFGKKIGTIINYILAFNISITGLIILNNTVNFIIIHYLKETPKTIILIAIGLTIIYTATKEIQVIAHSSFIIFIFIIFLTICSTIGLITKFNINNILPILESGISKTINSGNKITLTSILPLFILLNIPKNSIKNNKNITKYILVFYLISMFLIFILTILSIGILGDNIIKIYAHPEYIILKKISLFGFIDHIENIVYLKWIFNSIITLTLIIYYISTTIKIKKNNKYNLLLTTSIIIIAILILYKKYININKYILKNYYYLNILNLIILLIIFINILKKRRSLHIKTSS